MNVESLRKQLWKNKRIEKEIRFVVASGGGEELGEVGQKKQTFSYKLNKF